MAPEYTVAGTRSQLLISTQQQTHYCMAHYHYWLPKKTINLDRVNTFRLRGVYILRGLSSHQSWRPLNFNIPHAGVF